MNKKKTRIVTQVDVETGEELNGFLCYIPRKRMNYFYDGWFAMRQNALKEFRNAKLNGRDYDVLFCLLENLDFENLIHINQTDIAQELNMEKTNVNRSIKRLSELGALLKGPKVGRNCTYRLNPNFGWKGSTKNHEKAIKKGFKLIQGGKKEG